VSDCEYEFEFSIDDTEYDDILKELRAKDSDLEEIGEISLSCPYADCTRTFSRKYNLTRHMRSHEITSLDIHTGAICHICGKNIKGVYSLHLKIHQNLKQFRCTECGREFRQKVALRNHQLIHRNEKPHECQWSVLK
jgi:KRAB domain-containing zinc finger protein